MRINKTQRHPGVHKLNITAPKIRMPKIPKANFPKLPKLKKYPY